MGGGKKERMSISLSQKRKMQSHDVLSDGNHKLLSPGGESLVRLPAALNQPPELLAWQQLGNVLKGFTACFFLFHLETQIALTRGVW